MRLAMTLSLVAVLGGIGCAGSEPPPKTPEQDDRAWEEPPMTAPDDPPPAQPRPKLTHTVSLGETPGGVPSLPTRTVQSRTIGGAAPAPTSTSWTRRDLFAEDRASQPRTMRPTTRAWYRYGRSPMRVSNPGHVVSAPHGTPRVGGNWPAAH